MRPNLRFVALFHALINVLLVAARLSTIRFFFENRGQRRTRIFRVNVDSSGENRLLTDERAREIKAPLHWQVSSGFDDLREKFSQNELLGEVLGSDHDAIGMTFTT